MKTNLFRREVLEARQTDRLGGIQLQPPTFGWISLAFGSVCVGTILVLLFLGSYTRHEQVRGALVPDLGMLNVTPMNSGLVTRVFVEEGSAVHVGDALIEISGEQDSASLGKTRAAVTAQLQLKQAQLDGALESANRTADSKERDLHARIDILQEQLAQIKEQISVQRQRIELATSLYEKWLGLSEKGFITKTQITQQHDAVLQSELQLREMNRQSLAVKQQLSQSLGELRHVPDDVNKQRDDIHAQLSDITQSLSENEARRAVILRAPQDGTVANCLAHTGQFVMAQQTVLTVLPAHAILKAEVWLPSRAVGFVTQGDRIAIHYQAFPYQQFGEHFGTVSVVSHSPVEQGEPSKVVTADGSEAHYRLLVNLDHQEIQVHAKGLALRPGMELEATILLERHRLIDWIIEPFIGDAFASRG